MKIPALVLALGLPLSSSVAAVFTDASGDVAVGSFPHLDVTGVEVTTDATAGTITFQISVAGSPIATNWGKYLIALRTGPGGTATGNGWSRPINLPVGMTHWIGTWVDATPPAGQVYSWTGSAWSQIAAPVVSASAGAVTITANLADLALEPGETFSFDVYTTGGGGGDGAVDAASAATASITNWPNAFSSTTPLSFTVPGTPALPAAWLETYFTPAEIAQRPAGPAANNADPDGDTLTNLQEYQSGSNPREADTDADGLQDAVETGTTVFVSATNTGSSPILSDTDGDGFDDGAEVSGTALNYVSNPNLRNVMAVAGSFNQPSPWDAGGNSTPTNRMTADGTSLTTQYQWTLDTPLGPGGSTSEFKFTSRSFAFNWGTGTPGVAAPNGGNLRYTVGASGVHQFKFDQLSLAWSVTRRTYADVNSYLIGYGLEGSLADTDGDSLTDSAEFTANTDPRNADTDNDGIPDNLDSEPLIAAPLTRDVLFAVNMNVRLAAGTFTGTPPVRLIGAFNNWDVNGGVILADPDNDGIFTGTLSVPGVPGSTFGGYKFYSDFYEAGDDRTLLAGPANQLQTLTPVFYGNTSTFTTPYGTWAASESLGGTNILPTADPDGDGASNLQEYLFGGNPLSGGESFLTTEPTASGLILRWIGRNADTAYQVVTTTDPAATTWPDTGLTPQPAADQTNVPAGATRWEVTVPTSDGRRFYRVSGRTL
jgi:hypothetical protein